MNRVICVNGHFYDGDKYASCPHCAEGAPAIEPSHFAVVQTDSQSQISSEGVDNKKKDKEKKGLFGRKKDSKAFGDTIISEDDIKTERLSPEESSISFVSQAENMNSDVAQTPISQTNVQSMVENTEPIVREGVTPYVQPVSAPIQSTPVPVQPTPTPVQAGSSQVQSVSVTPKQAPSLQSALVQAADARKKAADEGKTIGYFSTGSSEPPVGYLICIKGEDFGKGFSLKSGSNSIGRSQSMDVVVMDPKVSRDKQAYVMYEPRKREFYVRPGESSSLCYYNDEMLMSPTKIEPYDKIVLGDTVLMLIAVCSEKFSWDECER